MLAAAGGRAVRGNLAIDQPDMARRVAGHVVLVGDHDDGHPLRVQIGQHLHDLVAAFLVEVAGGLVGQDHLRAGHQRPRDRHPLLLPAGKLGRIVMLAAFKPDPRQRLARQCPAPLAPQPLVDQRQFDVFQRRCARQKVEALKDEAEIIAPDQRPLVAGQPRHVDAVKQVVPAGGCIEATEHVHRGRLARAGRPHDGDEFAARDAEADPGQRKHLGLAGTVAFGDVTKLDQRSRGAHGSLLFAHELSGDH